MNVLDLKPLEDLLSGFKTQGRTMLLPSLHSTQNLYGYIPPEAAKEIAASLNVPLAEVYGVIEFYTLFHSEPVGKTIVHVCNDPVCAMAGSESVLKVMTRTPILPDKFSFSQGITIEYAHCLGLCEHAPALLVDGQAVMGKNIETLDDVFLDVSRQPISFVGGDIRNLTRNCGKNIPTNLDAYLKSGGYQALQTAINLSPDEIIEMVKSSGLVGRGGAAFPTGIKWESAAKEASPIKFLVCNGDEAEPGTFKDLILMENDPHSIIEGMIIAGLAIGAQKGYFYIRGEYQNAFAQVEKAIQEALSAGFLGENIQGSGFTFHIEARLGAGAYVCGEETALFESIEGKRGFPRTKPPFPTTFGLFGKPTVINNVETLANIPLILNQGITKYRSIGTEKSPGSKLFCLSGDVEKPGLYEVPFGITLRSLIENLAGGVRNKKRLKAVLIGGAAGALATIDQLDVKLTFEDLRAAGLPLGSGVITVFDDSRDLMDILLRLAHFFAEESCGKCFPCQIGTKRQYEILQRINKGNIQKEDFERLQDLITTMTDTSLCGLGQTAGSAIMSVMKNWPELFMPASIGSGKDIGGINVG
jgi:NADH-quinone oxidoreductase subunit F